jgi:predicted enzyme related to lactoylglutathione lyase
MAGSHHSFDLFEIRVLDMAGAKAFYGAAFGWTFEDRGTVDPGGCELAVWTKAGSE